MYPQSGLLNRIRAQIIHDRILTSILSAYFTINVLLILLAGAAVWPVILTFKGNETPVAGLCETIYRTNLLLLLVYLVISGAFMLFERGFRFVSTELINIGVGSLVNLIVLMTQRFTIQGLEASSFMLTLLWFIVSFLFSGILALLPSAVICGLAKLIHAVFIKFHDWGN